MDAVPVFPSLAAVIVADPAATAVTTPLADTVAMLASLEAQVTARPDRTVPDASLVVAVSATASPTVGVALAGVTDTVATGSGGGVCTVTVAMPLRPSLAAVIWATPAATAVTTPVAETVATPGALDDQLMLRPVRTVPEASRVVAEREAVPPTMSVVLSGDTVTLATGAGGGGFTVICAVPLFPSLVAVIVAEPGATAVTVPLAASTVAIWGALESHVAGRPVNALFEAS